ncbi:MAG: hypothetical protein H6Q61_1121 [Firmicutes bacterium]|nr:hypothetical protein [Bacillota bacterium]
MAVVISEGTQLPMKPPNRRDMASIALQIRLIIMAEEKGTFIRLAP